MKKRILSIMLILSSTPTGVLTAAWLNAKPSSTCHACDPPEALPLLSGTIYLTGGIFFLCSKIKQLFTVLFYKKRHFFTSKGACFQKKRFDIIKKSISIKVDV